MNRLKEQLDNASMEVDGLTVRVCYSLVNFEPALFHVGRVLVIFVTPALAWAT